MRGKSQFSLRNWAARPIRDLRWLAPGLGVKRWLLVVLAGTTLLALGAAVFILDIYRNTPDSSSLTPLFSLLSLRFLARPLRFLVFGGLGLGLMWFGLVNFNKALLKPFMRPGKPLLDRMTTYRKLERGPRIVAIGGGTGLSALLRGLKERTSNLTAIVTVADDGGSSGELRRNMGVLPPGDIRNCLAALSDDEELLTQIFQYRFGEGAGLGGHSFGNLFLTALTDVSGSFEGAVVEASKVLAVRGQVLPSSLHDVRLVADVEMPGEGTITRVKGESSITGAQGKIRRVWLEPNNPLAYPPALQAILSADLIVIGPGSLYTSLLPNLLVPDIAEALRASRAMKFYVCNVATQPGETDGYNCLDHVLTLEKHLGKRLFDMVVCNSRYHGNLPAGVDWVMTGDLSEEYPCYCTDLIDTNRPWRHDSAKLSDALIDLYNERTGPLLIREEPVT